MPVGRDTWLPEPTAHERGQRLRRACAIYRDQPVEGPRVGHKGEHSRATDGEEWGPAPRNWLDVVDDGNWRSSRRKVIEIEWRGENGVSPSVNDVAGLDINGRTSALQDGAALAAPKHEDFDPAVVPRGQAAGAGGEENGTAPGKELGPAMALLPPLVVWLRELACRPA